MTPPSSSSFPPSFSSFPDIEQDEKKLGPSSLKRTEEHRKGQTRHRDQPGQSGRHDSPDSRNRRTKKKKDVKHSRHKAHVKLDDERSKREEDRHVRLGSTNYGGSAPGLFIVDKVGDPMNVVYDGIHAGDIPRYRRSGYGNILGLGKVLKIVTRGTGGKTIEVGFNGRRPPARYTDPRSLSILNSQPRRFITTSKDIKRKSEGNGGIEAEAEFVRLPSKLGRTPTDEPLSTYRSIDTAAEVNANSDSDASESVAEDNGTWSSESDADKTIPRTASQHSIAALEAALQKDPRSLSTWFMLLDRTLSTAPTSAKSSLARARAEIKLSVLDRAINSHKDNKYSAELRLKWLNVGSEIWDAAKLEKEWEQAVRDLGGLRRDEEEVKDVIWGEWLQYRINNAGRSSRGNEGIEGILNDTRRVMENITEELALVRIFWRIAVVLKEAGYPERAMALFQAQAELILSCVPSLASAAFSIRVDAFEEFWDAEQPRIGELDARGWNIWIQDGKLPLVQSCPLLPQPEPIAMDVDNVSDPYTRWATDEARLHASSSMPRHTDSAGDDPYATVLFSDIKPFLVDLTTAEAKHAFRVAWLEFLGLHVPGFGASLRKNTSNSARDDIWSQVYLTRPAYLGKLFPPKGKGKDRDWDAYAGIIVAREKTYGPTFGCIKEWGMHVFDPLEHLQAGEGRLWEDVDVSDIDKNLARRIFKQLRQKVNSEAYDEEWDTMALALEAAINVKSALKLSRSLLSTSRNSLPRWGAHARLEAMRGKLEEARRIYDTSLSTNSRRGEANLWWAWAEMEWLAGDDNRSLAVILRASGFDPAAGGAVTILRAKRELEYCMRSQGSTQDWKEREAWACLRALLEMLAGGAGTIEEGMGILARYIDEARLEGVPKESAWTRLLLLSWKHSAVLGRPMRRVSVRNTVTKVIHEIERNGSGINTIGLGVFLESEKGESVWGRVKALVGEGVLPGNDLTFKSKEKGVARRVWEVWLANWEKGGWDGERERVRNSLSIAMGEERTRGSSILWRIFVEFELYCGELKRAKALLFRAVAECPLVKELYLLAFGPLRSVFTPRELENWAETMAERGIRMHRGLDEYVNSEEQREASGSSSESAGEEYLEQESRDYRRLAPF